MTSRKNSPRTPYEAALLLAAIALRSKNRFSRVGRKTLLKVSGRKKLAIQVQNEIKVELYELGYEVIQLGTSWVLVQTAALDSSARTVTAKRWLTDAEKEALVKGLPIAIDALEAEIEGESDSDPDSEDDEG